MSLPKIPVACVQPGAHNRDDFETAWPRIVTLTNEAGKRGARLIVLPEGTVPGYVLGMQPVPSEQLARAADDVRTLARRYDAVIVYGGAKIVAGRTFNAAICVGPSGDELGYAAKQFLWHFDRRWFAAGDTLQPIETPLGTLGVLVCADGRIPTIAGTLVERGAGMLVMPTAWVTSGRDPAALENMQADLMANVRAYENRVPFVVANKSGIELESVAYCGKSAIIDAGGAFVARGTERGEEIVFGEVELAAPRGPDAARKRSRERLSAAAAAAPDTGAARARIAFTPATKPADTARFAAAADVADCNLLLSRADVEGRAETMLERAGVRFAAVSDETMRDPAGLTGARMDGVDLFVWTTAADDPWTVRIARTRAAELRAFVIVFESDTRSFAVDPDGVVVAGTFDSFRMASFVYDRARARATTVAPTTDVLAGLRVAEAIRTRA